jgi:cytochrome c1
MWGMRAGLRALKITICVAAGLTSGCRQQSAVIAGTRGFDKGAVDRGRSTIVVYGCGKCHTIPGIRGARGVVGPPLETVARRTYIGGNFPNTPDSLTHWIMDPQTMKPKTAMPSLGLSEPQSRDVVAYLETLN